LLGLASLVFAIPSSALTQAMLCAALITHAALVHPRCPARIVVHADGSCTIPAKDGPGFALDPSSHAALWWMRLVLTRGEERVVLLLIEDQLPAAVWWRMQALVREASGR
jgi:hypothetical protein